MFMNLVKFFSSGDIVIDSIFLCLVIFLALTGIIGFLFTLTHKKQ